MIRFWWLDNTDVSAARQRLSKIRKERLSSWEWSRWYESDYDDADKAFRDLIHRIGIPPMLSEGKVICCYGIPSFHEKISKELDEIPSGVLFIVVARPDARTILYKTGKNYEFGLVDDPLKMATHSDAVQWAKDKAHKMGIKADDLACEMLVDLVGKNASKLASELNKLKHLSNDGTLHPWAVEQGCYGTGEADVREMCESISQRKFDMAHRSMARLLARGEAPLKICGFLMDWVQKMNIADSREGDYNLTKEVVSKLRKYKKPDKDLSDRLNRLRLQLEVIKDKKKASKIWRDIEKVRKKMKEPSPLMFPKPGALFYSCSHYNQIALKKYWTYFILQELGMLQLSLRRSKKDPKRLMHGFLSKFSRLEEEKSNG